MKQIPLSQGKFALVDDADFEWLSQWKWCYHPEGYALRSVHLGIFNGKRKRITVWMHRFILNPEVKTKTDHRDGDGLNNQRYNLRRANNTESCQNRRSFRGASSKFKGVSWHKKSKKWHVYIQSDKRHYIGAYESEIHAAAAYDEAAVKYHGEFARLNNA